MDAHTISTLTEDITHVKNSHSYKSKVKVVLYIAEEERCWWLVRPLSTFTWNSRTTVGSFRCQMVNDQGKEIMKCGRNFDTTLELLVFLFILVYLSLIK